MGNHFLLYDAYIQLLRGKLLLDGFEDNFEYRDNDKLQRGLEIEVN